MSRHWLPALLLLTLAGCATPGVIPEGHVAMTPRLDAGYARMPDGYRLPLRVFAPPEATDAAPVVVLCLHGLNDYGQACAPMARQLAGSGVVTFAVDQRGFGAGAGPGRWHGEARLAGDVAVLTELLRARYPKARLVLIGESMGAAVAMLADTRTRLPIDGLVLIAPAVWTRETMPWYQRAALAGMVRIAPGLKLTGEGVPIHPSDNIPMLRAMGADPLVLKATRVDALWGVANLMDAAMAVAPDLRGPVLLLYGEHDQIIPRKAFCHLRDTLREAGAAAPDLRLVLYRRGWHMLPRDLQGQRVNADIAAWLADPSAPLPSGEEGTVFAPRLAAFCRGRADQTPPGRPKPHRPLPAQAGLVP